MKGRDIQLGEKNKGCKKEWRKARVTKREWKRTLRYHSKGPKKDSAGCEVSGTPQE